MMLFVLPRFALVFECWFVCGILFVCCDVACFGFDFAGVLGLFVCLWFVSFVICLVYCVTCLFFVGYLLAVLCFVVDFIV